MERGARVSSSLLDTKEKGKSYLRWSDLINLLWQTGQIKFFSPVCVLVCRANSSERAKRLPHPNQEQGKGRSPEKRKKVFIFPLM